MAWEWSHTVEAYENLRTNLETLDRETLIVCIAEFREHKLDSIDSDRESFGTDYDEFVARYTADKILTSELLAGELWPLVEELAICDNGGFDAHICPYGCGCHKLSFDLIEKD